MSIVPWKLSDPMLTRTNVKVNYISSVEEKKVVHRTVAWAQMNNSKTQHPKRYY
jgi:hypothetical protein